MRLDGMVKVGLMAVALSASAATKDWLDLQPRQVTPADDQMYFTSGETLNRASFGYHAVLADWYWIRTIHYFGSQVEAQRGRHDALDLSEMPWLKDLLAMTVALDPHHVAAYRFGAFFLASSDREYALYFAREGVRENPREWRLYQDLGFLYWRLGRYREAAGAYERGSRISGAPLWMQSMAAVMLARGGERETARAILTQLLESTDDEFIRDVCRRQLEMLMRDQPARS